MFESSRRGFLKIAGGFGAALAGAKLLKPSIASAAGATAPAAGALVMVTESDPLAKSLGYHQDATKVDVKKWPKRAGPEGAKQFCYDCMFFQAKGDPKSAAAAPCQIFAGKGVKAKAWCNSWTQNPNVKA